SSMAVAPKVSVVMPVRNVAGTLPIVLDSVTCQTLPDWELVAVDDGSKDETAGILASAARADPRIRVFSQAALGIAEALQRGCAAGASQRDVPASIVAGARRLRLGRFSRRL